MGITSFDIKKLDEIIEKYNPKNVIEAGAQNLYNQPLLPAPYANEYYESKGLEYHCIDLSKENNCIEWDLSQPQVITKKYNLVSNLGTSEHIGIDGKFNWEAIYNCHKTLFELSETGGISFFENPKSGHWQFHGFQYYTEQFYKDLVKYADYEILELGIHCAMSNCETGQNVYCIIKKVGERFPTLEEFKTLDLKTEFIKEEVVVETEKCKPHHLVEGIKVNELNDYFDGKVCDCGSIIYFKEACSCPNTEGWKIKSKPNDGN